MASQSSQSSTNRSYYPVDLNPLLENFTGNIGAATGNINNFLNNPLDSSMFKNTIGSILSALGPSEEARRTAVADQFRMAGGGQGGALQSGAFSNAVRQNERDILDNRGRVVAQNASDTFRNILSGLGLQLNAAEAPSRLIGNIRPLSEGSSQGSSSTSDPMQFLGYGDGGGGGGYGGGGSSFLGTASGDLARMDALTASNPNFTGYGGGGGYASTAVNAPQSQAPVDFYGFSGAYQPQFTQQPLQYNYGDGNWTTEDRSMRDQWGYTPSDWASDPYYQ